MIFIGMFCSFGFPVCITELASRRNAKVRAIAARSQYHNLISSSFVMHNADTSIKKNDVGCKPGWQSPLRWRIFLVGQLYEYSHLEFSLTTNLFASAFYVRLVSTDCTSWLGFRHYCRIVAIAHFRPLLQRKALWCRSRRNLPHFVDVCGLSCLTVVSPLSA